MGPRYDLRAVKQFLEANRQQTTLSLAYFCLDESGVEAVALFVRDNPFVKHLDLRGNDIQTRGITALSNGMKSNRSMRSLNLKWNSIGKDPAGLASLCEVLKSNLTIKQVDLQNNYIDAEGAKHVAEVLRTNSVITHIDLSWNNFRSEGGLALIDGLKRNQSVVDCQLGGSKVGQEVLHEVAFIIRRNIVRARKMAEDAPPAAPAAEATPAAGAKGGYEAGEDLNARDGDAAAEEPPVWRPRTVQEDRSMMLRILMRERDQPLPEDKAFYIEIAEHIDKLLVESNMHQAGRDDGKGRELQSTSGYQDREERYLRDILETEEGIKQSLVDISKTEVEVARQRIELKELIKEKEEEERLAVESKIRAELEEKQLTQELADMIAGKRILQEKMALVNRDLELLEEENERLAAHVEHFKKDMAAVLT